MPEVWLNYDEVCLNVATSQSGDECKSDTCAYGGTDIQMKIIWHIGRPYRIDTTHPIILVFSWIIIQSELWWGK